MASKAPSLTLSFPRLPNSPASVGVSGDVYRLLQSMSQWMQTRNGDLGDGSEKVVTQADLEALGLISDATKGVRAGETYDLSSSVVDTDAPAAPKNLVVTQKVWANELAWTNPTDDDFSHVEVWVAENSQLRDDAALFGYVTHPVATFSHGALSASKSYTYWIRAVDYAGNHSPWCPPDAQGGYVAPAGLSATITEVLSTLTGKLTENQLYADLVRRIDYIDTSRYTADFDIFDTGIVGGLTDYYIDGATKLVSLRTDVSNLQTTASGHLARLNALDAAVSGFVANDFNSGSTYSVGQYVRSGGKVYKCILPITTTPAPEPPNVTYWAESPDIVTLVSSVDSRVDALEGAIVAKVEKATYDVLAARVATAETNITQNANTIALKASQAALDTLTGRVDAMSTTVDIGQGNFTVLNSVIAGDIALLADIAEHGVVVTDFSDVANIDNRVSTTAFRMDAAEASIALAATKAEVSGSVGAVTSRVSSAETSINALSGITNTHESRIDTLDTTTGTHTTQIFQAQETLNAVKGQWTVKLQQHGTREAVAGVGLMLDPVTGASEFAVLADKFMVLNPGNAGALPKVPFVVGTVDGQTSVGIDGNLVVDGTIRARHIDAGAITADKLSADMVLTNVIRSGNYSAGSSGWRLTNSGGEFNTGVAINGDLLVNGTVAGTKIAAQSVTADKLAANQINASHIQSRSLSASCIASGAITSNEIAAGAITAAQLAAGSVEANKIAAGSIDSTSIKINGIDVTRIAKGVVLETGYTTANVNMAYASVNLAEAHPNVATYFFIRLHGMGNMCVSVYLNNTKLEDIEVCTAPDPQNGGYVEGTIFVPYMVFAPAYNASCIAWDSSKGGHITSALASIIMLAIK